MNTKLAAFLSVPLLIFIFLSCSKDYSLEGGQVSQGSLKDLNDNCLTSTVTGNYVAGKQLTDSNFIILQLRVTQIGTYNINTDTLNGYSFQSSGFFNDTGIVSIHLKGRGTPIKDKSDILHIHFNNSTCPVTIKVLPDPQNIPAVCTLHGSPNICTEDTINGIYVAGVPVSKANFVTVTLDVAVAGKFSITTNSVNGYSFSSTGIFNNTGVQSVKLAALGTPQSSATNIFTVTVGNSNCTFTILVVQAVATTNPDHFPLTLNSFWIYNLPDSIIRKNLGNTPVNSSIYQDFMEHGNFILPSHSYYKKTDTSYYEFASVTKYTRSFTFQPDVKGDILFLKEGLATGESWYSSEYLGNLNSSEKIYLRYTFFCEDNNLSITVNGKTFINVYKIIVTPFLHSQATSIYNSTGEVYIFYYAKGVGLIDLRTFIPNTTGQELPLNSWQVN